VKDRRHVRPEGSRGVVGGGGSSLGLSVNTSGKKKARDAVSVLPTSLEGGERENKDNKEKGVRRETIKFS